MISNLAWANESWLTSYKGLDSLISKGGFTVEFPSSITMANRYWPDNKNPIQATIVADVHIELMERQKLALQRHAFLYHLNVCNYFWGMIACNRTCASANELFRISPTRNKRQSFPSRMQITACLLKRIVAALFMGRASFANITPAIIVWHLK